MKNVFRITTTILLTVAALALIVTGVCMFAHYSFPHIGELHELSAAIFILATASHLILNRKGLARSFASRAGIVLACALVLGLAAFEIPARHATGNTGNRQNLTEITLPAPRTSGGASLLDALHNRQSQRSFSTTQLSAQQLSQIFWAAFGINRPNDKRTAPSARNWQEIELYAFTKDGIYLYEAKHHKLSALLAGDYREKTSMAGFAADAPLVIVYVADRSKAPGSSDEMWTFYSAVDTGFISQNVYLLCASEGLATVVLGSVDKKSVTEILGLSKDKTVVLAQPVGKPGR